MKSPFMARAAFSAVARKASSTDITLTVNILMASPPEYGDISVKASYQVLYRGEDCGVFLMVTFAAFVVVAHHTNPINDIPLAAFLLKATPQNRRVYLQNSDGGKCIIGNLDSGVHQLNGWHIFPLSTDVNHNIAHVMMKAITSKQENGQHSALTF